MSTPTDKKNIYFNFGPEDSYFLRCAAQHRSRGKIAGKSDNWLSGEWVKFDCVAWKTHFYFACRHKHDRINQNKANNAPPIFEEWMNKRLLCPLRFVVGPNAGNWFAWMLHGDFISGPNAPKGMAHAAKDLRKGYTSIRCAAVGVNDSWLLVWDNGDMVHNIESGYPELHNKLKGLRADDISGDYFLYEEEKKKASFRVSEAFGNDLRDVLISEGIDVTDMILRQQELVKPMNIPALMRSTNVKEVVAESVDINGDALLNAATKILHTTVSVVKVGATIAGIVACTVM